jgi:hypothetical protein
MNGLIVITIAGGLLMDYHWPQYGQMIASAWVGVLCGVLYLRTDRNGRPALVACLIIATAGEVFLSLGWGLYEYRLHNIPLFVPPGHVLVFFLGTQIAARMPRGSEWWIAILALPVVALFAWQGRDTLGPVLYGLFLACMLLSSSRKLYATMFVLSLAMELYGTWIGNWAWAPNVPLLGHTMQNPPLAAGTFYCVLDLLVVVATGRITAAQAAKGAIPASDGVEAVLSRPPGRA